MSSTEGDTFRPYFFNDSSFRYQQVDDASRGRVTTLRGVALRRDGRYATISTALSRTFRATLLMGTYGSSSATPLPTATFTRNYSGTPTTVIPATTFSMPNLNNQPASAPAAFNVQIPFNTPFTYGGDAALVMEARISSLSLLGFVPIDADVPPDTVGSGSPGPSPGCIVRTPAGPIEMAMTSTIANQGPLRGLVWQVSSTAPPSTPMGLILGSGVMGGNPLPQPPCTPLYPTPDIAILTIGNSNAMGQASFSLNISYNPFFAGSTVYVQTFGIDASQPMALALSRGIRQDFPANPRFLPVQHLFATNSSATTGTLVFNGGLVLQFYR